MSSSEDEEYSAALRDAIDTKFINDNMYKEKPKDQRTPDELKQRPSLRQTFNEDKQFENFGMTSQFRSFIANKLGEMLDKKLTKRLKYIQVNGIEKSPRKRKAKGIKLFKDSTVRIKKSKVNCDDTREHNAKCRAKRLENLESNNENECKIVAIDPKDILNKTATKHWSNRSKAEIYRYKMMKNGTLSLIEKEFV